MCSSEDAAYLKKHGRLDNGKCEAELRWKRPAPKDNSAPPRPRGRPSKKFNALVNASNARFPGVVAGSPVAASGATRATQAAVAATATGAALVAVAVPRPPPPPPATDQPPAKKARRTPKKSTPAQVCPRGQPTKCHFVSIIRRLFPLSALLSGFGVAVASARRDSPLSGTFRSGKEFCCAF